MPAKNNAPAPIQEQPISQTKPVKNELPDLNPQPPISQNLPPATPNISPESLPAGLSGTNRTAVIAAYTPPSGKAKR
jgi:hypothetical protein